MTVPFAHYPTTLQPLCNHYATTMQPLCNHYATTLQPLCNHYATTMQPLCNPLIIYNVFIRSRVGQIEGYHYAATMQPHMSRVQPAWTALWFMAVGMVVDSACTEGLLCLWRTKSSCNVWPRLQSPLDRHGSLHD